MKKDPRWLKSAVAASAVAEVSLPFQRGNRSKPAAMKPATAMDKPRAIAAR